MCLVVVVLLVSCQKEGASIKVVNLTESEKELISAIGVERYFAFDIDLSYINFEQLEYRVDYFENGKFVKTLSHGATGDLLEKKKQRLIWSQIKTGRNQDELWMITFNGSRMTQQVAISENIRGMGWSQNESINTVNPGEEVRLAAIVGTESGEIRSPGVIFDKEEGGIQSLENYDVAYVLTVIFTGDL